jgi:hypothetical protein
MLSRGFVLQERIEIFDSYERGTRVGVPSIARFIGTLRILPLRRGGTVTIDSKPAVYGCQQATGAL